MPYMPDTVSAWHQMFRISNPKLPHWAKYLSAPYWSQIQTSSEEKRTMKEVILQVEPNWDRPDKQGELVLTVEQVVINNQNRITSFAEEFRESMGEAIEEMISAAIDGEQLVGSWIRPTESFETPLPIRKSLSQILIAVDRVRRGERLLDALKMWGEPTITLSIDDFDQLVRDIWP